MRKDKNEELINILGLGRKAGILLIGQDQVKDALRAGKTLVATAACDCSRNVLRSLKGAEEHDRVTLITLGNADRRMLGRHLGVSSAQIVALPSGGLSQKVLSLYDRSDADE